MDEVPSIKERVASGAKWLDSKEPNWFNMIDLKHLRHATRVARQRLRARRARRAAVAESRQCE